MLRVAVVGNCQGEGIAAALHAMNPIIDARFIFQTEIQKGAVDLDALFASSNYVFSQRGSIPEVPKGMEHRLRLFPSVMFDAYHPDLTFLRGKRKGQEAVETIPSLLVVYHSAIACYGYSHQLSIDETLGYYNQYVTSRLGYFDRWDAACQALLAEGEAVGMPLSAELNRWISSGCFMYSSVHPHLRVLVDVARRMLGYDAC